MFRRFAPGRPPDWLFVMAPDPAGLYPAGTEPDPRDAGFAVIRHVGANVLSGPCSAGRERWQNASVHFHVPVQNRAFDDCEAVLPAPREVHRCQWRVDGSCPPAAFDDPTPRRVCVWCRFFRWCTSLASSVICPISRSIFSRFIACCSQGHDPLFAHSHASRCTHGVVFGAWVCLWCSVLVSAKFFDDSFLNNARYARVGGGRQLTFVLLIVCIDSRLCVTICSDW